jgi:hypothetical protein
MTTPGSFNDPHFGVEDVKDPKVRQAIEEGHDADIPSSTGYVDVEKKAGTPSSTSISDLSNDAHDPNIVDWEQPENEDPHNPQNWSMAKKWLNVAIVSYICLITYVSLPWRRKCSLTNSPFKTSGSILNHYSMSAANHCTSSHLPCLHQAFHKSCRSSTPTVRCSQPS